MDSFELLAETSAPGLAMQIREHGYAVVTGAFSTVQVAQAAGAARLCLVESGKEYCAVTGPLRQSGEILGSLSEDGAMKSLLSGLHGELFPNGGATITITQTLRCLSGKLGRKHSLYFHYDYSVLTVIIPLAMPQAGASGDLLIFPGCRPIRRTYVANVADKIVSDLPPLQFLFRVLKNRVLHPVRIQLIPGNIYIFLGYQSLHTNEPGNPAELRATLVLHAIDPHECDPFRNWVKRVAARRKNRSRSPLFRKRLRADDRCGRSERQWNFSQDQRQGAAADERRAQQLQRPGAAENQ
jgi:hypothetical protein